MTPGIAPVSPRVRLLGLLLAALVGCSLLPSTGGPRPADAFDTGLERLEAQRHDEAVASLAAVARTCGMEPLGQQAALALTVLELDPRYGDGEPVRAARLALHLLQHPDRSPWTARMAGLLYLLAADRRAATDSLGAAPVTEVYPAEGDPSVDEPPVGDCGARLAAAAPDSAARPRLSGPPAALRHARLRTRLERLEAEVDRLRSLLEPPDEPR